VDLLLVRQCESSLKQRSYLSFQRVAATVQYGELRSFTPCFPMALLQKPLQFPGPCPFSV